VQSESLVHVSRSLTDLEPPVVADDPPDVDVEPPAAWTEPSMEVSTLPLQLVTRANPTRTWNIETSDELALFMLVPRSVAPEPGTITGISLPVFVDQPEHVEGVLGFNAIEYPCLGLIQFVAQETWLPGVNSVDESMMRASRQVLENRRALADVQ